MRMPGALAVIAVAVAAGVAGLAAGLWMQHRATVPAPALAIPARPVVVATVGEPMPPLSLRGLDGHPVQLPGAWQGRRLLINAWASWCRPCLEEMPALDRLARSQGAEGVQVVGIALDTPENVRAFLRATPVAYPILLETPGPADATVLLGNSRGLLPYSVLVDADGRILRQKLGPFAPGELDPWLRQGAP